MAKKQGQAAQKDAKPGGGLVLALAAITAAAAALGAGSAFIISSMGGSASQALMPGSASDSTAKLPSALLLVPVPEIFTNLRGPGNNVIRLETALAVEPGTPDTEILAAKISEDFLAYLRTTSLADIEGPSGFLYLREDLIDRARIRSEGKVRDVLIQAFAVE